VDEKQTRKLAAAWSTGLRKTDAWPWDADRSEASGVAAWGAVYNALRSTVPDAEQACVVARRDEVPVVYALADGAVFEVECVAVDTPVHNAYARVTRFHLDPAEMPVEIRTLSHEQSGFHRLSIEWTFELRRGQPLRMQTTFESESDPEPDHLFAVALARHLGWQLPLHPEAVAWQHEG
jgi:hypothetical protein